jgi:putative Mg2+ transporter-C (MgtC) family protein
MLHFWEEVFSGSTDVAHLLRVLFRVTFACFCGGVVGWERHQEGKSAGMRTHMLVAMGAAIFTMIPQEAGMDTADLSRVIQGVAAGIGFLGAGTILKLEEQHKIEGLTSAAAVWLTAAIGTAVGAGWLWPAGIGVLWGWIVLSFVHRLEQKFRSKKEKARSDSATNPR